MSEQPKQVAMVDLASHMHTELVFAKFVIANTTYPPDFPRHNIFLYGLLKGMSYDAFKRAQVSFGDQAITIQDEHQDDYAKLASDQVVKLTLGCYRTLARVAPMPLPTNRFLLAVTIQTTDGNSYQFLNDSRKVLAPLTNWLAQQPFTVADPMRLRAVAAESISDDELIQRAQGTEFAAPLQMISGSNPDRLFP